MRKHILIYGSIGGGIVLANMMLSLLLGKGGGVPVWLGYLVMIVAMTMIFIGTKKYRDRVLGGVIRFWPAFAIGLGISFLASLFYVIGWEIIQYFTEYAFIGDYAAAGIKAKQEAGVTGPELEAFIAKMDELVQQYANPLYRVPMTFAEIFPVGLVISLVSAALLRNPAVLPARN